MKGLRLENFGWHTLKDIDLQFSEGQCAGLLGPSGSGKSLFLRAVADLDPHEGAMRLNGVGADQIPADQWRRRVGLLPAESAWWFDKVGDHFNNVAGAYLEKLGFTREVLTWQISRLSSGEKQRLALLRVLVNQPQVLLLDEPTANLDKKNSDRVEGLLDEYRRANHPVIIWVSHDPEQLHRWCDPIYIIEGETLNFLPPAPSSEMREAP